MAEINVKRKADDPQAFQIHIAHFMREHQEGREVLRAREAEHACTTSGGASASGASSSRARDQGSESEAFASGGGSSTARKCQQICYLHLVLWFSPPWFLFYTLQQI